jgi:hypothetical protein
VRQRAGGRAADVRRGRRSWTRRGDGSWRTAAGGLLFVPQADAGAADKDGESSVTFPELVLAHYVWRRGVGTNGARDSETSYRDALVAFERDHGRIIDSYWCLEVPSAVALTAKPRQRFLRWFRKPMLSFHRVTDWATKGESAIAAQLHRCDDFAVRSTQVLTGKRQHICLRLVVASASHLLSLVDARAAHDKGLNVSVLDQEKKKLDLVWQYYVNAANGQAQMVYFLAMGIVATLLASAAAVAGLEAPIPHVDDREFFGSLAAGALGAVVSVIQRINSGRFRLEYDVGRPYVFFLGSLRPLLGAAFGLLLYFAVTSGLLEVFNLPEGATERFYGLLVIAFLAGFSERWAQDTLTSLAPAAPAEADAAAARDLTAQASAAATTPPA